MLVISSKKSNNSYKLFPRSRMNVPAVLVTVVRRMKKWAPGTRMASMLAAFLMLMLLLPLTLILAIYCNLLPAGISTTPREYRNFIIHKTWEAYCLASSVVLNPITDFSFLSNPNKTYPSGVTHQFVRLRDLYEPGYVIPNAQACQNGVHFIVTVASIPQNFDNRNAVRETWGPMLEQLSNGSAKVLFFVGQTSNSSVQQLINHEQAIYKDIVQGMNEDGSRKYLSMKEYAQINWIHEFCPHGAEVYAMKFDDDLYMNVPRVLQYLREGNVKPGTMHGLKLPGYCGLDISEDPSGNRSHLVHPDVYPYKRLPPYLGATYIYRMDVAASLVAAGSKAFFWDLPSDMYITGVLRAQAKNVELVRTVWMMLLFGETALPLLSEGAFRSIFSLPLHISHGFGPNTRSHITPTMMRRIHQILHG